MFEVADTCLVKCSCCCVATAQATIFSLEVDGTVPVLSVREADYLSCLRIDALALRSLGIFCEEAHPNVLKGRGRSKEVSILALFLGVLVLA
jgi:hypothetical protein